MLCSPGSLFCLARFGCCRCRRSTGAGRAALLCCAAGVLGAASYGFRGRGGGADFVPGLVLPSLFAIALPEVLLAWGAEHLAPIMGVASMAATPLLAGLLGAALDEQAPAMEITLLPAVTALGGLLLILPVSLPASRSGWIGLGLYFAASGCSACGSVLYYRQTRGQMSVAAFRTASLTTCGAMLLLWAVFRAAGFETGLQEPSMFGLLPAGAIFLAGTGALIALLGTLLPAALASRFVLAPLLGAVEAYALLRPTLSWRAGIGAFLTALGAGLLLRSTAHHRASATTSLR